VGERGTSEMRAEKRYPRGSFSRTWRLAESRRLRHICRRSVDGARGAAKVAETCGPQ